MNPIYLAVPQLAAGSSSGTNYLPLLLIAGLFVLTYFMIIRPQSKRRRGMVEMQSSLSAGAQVVTIGGLYATVVGTDADTVDLQIAPGVTVTYARGAISKILTPAQQPDEGEDAGAESTESDSAVASDPAAEADDTAATTKS